MGLEPGLWNLGSNEKQKWIKKRKKWILRQDESQDESLIMMKCYYYVEIVR